MRASAARDGDGRRGDRADSRPRLGRGLPACLPGGLYVDPDWWSRGVGQALIRRAEERLAATWSHAILCALADNPRTRRVYELAGREAEGTRGSFTRFGVETPSCATASG